jgi:hypothetical protein
LRLKAKFLKTAVGQNPFEVFFRMFEVFSPNFEVFLTIFKVFLGNFEVFSTTFDVFPIIWKKTIQEL